MRTSTIRSDHGAFDFAKFLAACAVVAIHTSPFKSYSGMLNLVCALVARLAVPLFFSISSFFLFSKILSTPAPSQWRVVWKYVRRLLALLSIWLLIGSPVIWERAFVLSKTPPGSFLINILLSPVYNALWYLAASIYGSIVVYALYRWFGMRATLLAGFVFHLLCAMSDAYRGLMPLGLVDVFNSFEHIVGAPVECSAPSGIMFLALGGWFAIREREGRSRPRRRLALTGFLVSLFLLLIEGIACTAFLRIVHSQIYFFFLLPVVFWAMTLLLDFHLPVTGSTRRLRSASALVYLTHPLVIAAMRHLRPEGMDSLLFYLLVLATSLFVAWAVLRLEAHRKLTWLRHTH